MRLTAFASVYAPCLGRDWWWIAYLCPYCGAGHLGRARTEDRVAGVRRARCGGLVTIIAARTYRGRPAVGDGGELLDASGLWDAGSDGVDAG